MKEILLLAEGLNKSFAHNGIQNHVLSDVNLTVYKGDFTVIMGASGSGKSTLLYCLSGMDHPTSGKVTYGGKEITGLSEKKMAVIRQKDFGFVFQQTHLVSNLTLFENIAVPGYLDKGKTSREVKERTLNLLKKVNAEKVKDRLVSQVSGGEAQRAAVARSVINKPGILFADEPTGALNRKNTEDVLNLLTELNEEGQSILMVTHDIRAALRADRLLYLDDGKICGEMILPPYQAQDIRNRETQITSWLHSMDW